MVFDRVWDIYHCLSNRLCYEISFIKVKACTLMNLLCSKWCSHRCSKISCIRSWSYQVYDRLSIILMIEPIWIFVPSWNPSPSCWVSWLDSRSLFQEKTTHDRSLTTDQQGQTNSISYIGPVTGRNERPASNLSVRTYQNWKDQLGCEWEWKIIISQTPASKI